MIFQVRYSLSFKSSNETIMRHPTTNIRLNGLVPKRTKGKARPATKKSKSPGNEVEHRDALGFEAIYSFLIAKLFL